VGLIEESVHLYIERGGEHIRTQFHVTNLGRDWIILGYPWLKHLTCQLTGKTEKFLDHRLSSKQRWQYPENTNKRPITYEGFVWNKENESEKS
jgi:hypothetical protein